MSIRTGHILAAAWRDCYAVPGNTLTGEAERPGIHEGVDEADETG